MASPLLAASPGSQLTQSHATDPVAQDSQCPTPHPPRLRDLHDTPFSHGLTPLPAALPGSYVPEGHTVGCFHQLSQKLTPTIMGTPDTHCTHSLVCEDHPWELGSQEGTPYAHPGLAQQKTHSTQGPGPQLLNSQAEGGPKSGQPGHLPQVFSDEPNVSEPPKAGAGLASHMTLEF